MKKSLEEIYQEMQIKKQKQIEDQKIAEQYIYEQREKVRQNYLNDIKRYESISTGKIRSINFDPLFLVTFSESEVISFELRIQSLTKYVIILPSGEVLSGSSDQNVQFDDLSITPGVMFIRIEDNLAINGVSFVSFGISKFEISKNIDNVVTINLQGNVITEFINNGYAPISLSNLLLSDNRLPVSEVNSIISWVLTGGVSDGVLSLNGQTPPASPTGQGASDRLDLVLNYNWTIPID